MLRDLAPGGEGELSAAALLAELDREAKATRRVLERVPKDKLEWRPHAKSMSLGQLAGHVASIPGNISQRGGMFRDKRKIRVC